MTKLVKMVTLTRLNLLWWRSV